MGVFSDKLLSSQDETIKDFRNNFPDVFGPICKILDEVGSQQVRAVESRLAPLERAATQEQRVKFEAILSRTVPDWRQVFQDPNWTAWLNKIDRYGMKRMDSFRAADKKFDAQAIVNLIADFRQEMGFPGGPAQGPNIGAPGENVSLSSIRQFARDVSRGKYKGREKEAEAIQSKIDAATASGNILNQ